MEQHGGGTVLIADDHPLFREALRQVVAVTLPDHMVIQASSLKEAEAVTVTEGLDLVLLDINMPGMNGFNGLVHLCNIFPATPIVIVSADESVETVREAMTLGAWGFIPKSMDAPQMADAVQRVMAGEIFIPIDLSEGAASQDRYMVDDDFKKGYAALTSQQRKVLELDARPSDCLRVQTSAEKLLVFGQMKYELTARGGKGIRAAQRSTFTEIVRPDIVLIDWATIEAEKGSS